MKQQQGQVQGQGQQQQGQQRGPAGGQMALQSQPHTQAQQQVQQRQLGQPNQPNSTGQGAHQQQLVLSNQHQQQQGQALQHRQASGGPVGSALSPPAQIGGPSNDVLPGALGEPSGPPGPGVDAQRQQQYSKQQRWLLFLRHASRCTAPEGQCHITPHCHMARQLWGHISACRDRECTFSRCNASRTLLHHHQHCRDPRCPVCGPVRQQVLNQQRQAALQGAGVLANSVTSAVTTVGVLSPGGLGSGIESSPPQDAAVLEEVDIHPPPAKRTKTEPMTASPVLPSSQPLQTPVVGSGKLHGLTTGASLQTSPRPQSVVPSLESEVMVRAENVGTGLLQVKVEPHFNGQTTGVSSRHAIIKGEVKVESRPQQPGSIVKPEPHSGGLTLAPAAPVKAEPVSTGGPVPSSTVTSTKTGKPKNLGTSLTELFTPEQIREHITGLRQWVGQVQLFTNLPSTSTQRSSAEKCRMMIAGVLLASVVFCLCLQSVYQTQYSRSLLLWGDDGF